MYGVVGEARKLVGLAILVRIVIIAAAVEVMAKIIAAMIEAVAVSIGPT